MRLYDEIIHDILTSLEKQDKHILPVGAAAGCRKSNDDLTVRYGI